MDKSEKKRVLDEFGAKFIEYAWDDSVRVSSRILSGKSMNAEEGSLCKRSEHFTQEDRAIIGDLMRFSLEQGLGNTLWFFEDQQLPILFEDSTGQKNDITSLSDGLCGELPTKDGWIQRFSQFKAGIQPNNDESVTPG